MSDQKLIVILGATGMQGGSVVETFLSDPSWKIRALTRNASSSKAQSLVSKSPNIEVVSADANDGASLLAAFKDAHAIFAVTDFWTLYGDPNNKDKPKPGQALNEWSFEMELQQGRNIFDAAAQIPTLERLVFSSLSNAKKWSGGKYSQVLHFDGKALAAEYGQTTYPELWSKTSIIQVGMYLSNFLVFPWLRPFKSDDGSYVFKSVRPSKNPTPWVAADHESGAITRALVQLPAGKNVIAYRELLTWDEFVQLWGRTLGVQAKVEYGPLVAPEDIKQELEETWQYAEEFGYWAYEDKSVIHPKDLDAKLELGTVEDWIKAQDWSSVLTN